MIQDIFPDRLENEYRDINPDKMDAVICFKADRIAAKFRFGRLEFPLISELRNSGGIVYLFTAGGKPYFLLRGEIQAPEGYNLYSLQELRTIGLHGNLDVFIVYTAYHLWKWYENSRFCGKCGRGMELAHDERAMMCPECGNRVYPRINPAVIVGVKNGDRILITRYKEGYRHSALIAGFTEIGETVEQTVQREVMEEAGLRVKNIRYFGSQPWGIAADLLMGFYCEVDGDDTIRRDDRELGYAEWVSRGDIILQPSGHSLTNEMMKRFKTGEEK